MYRMNIMLDQRQSVLVDRLSKGKIGPIRAMARHGGNDGSDRDTGVIEAPAKAKLMEPPMYMVILLNDDYTPMEFVIEVLQIFFGMNREKATQIMLAVHTTGKGTCGIFTRDVAETKSAQVNQYAQDQQHPLVSEIEAVQ